MGNFDKTFSVLVFPLEFLGALIVYLLPLEKRKYTGALIAAGAGVILFFNWALRDAFGFMGANWSAYILWCVINFAIMIGIAFAACRISLKEAVYCATCSYFTEHIAYCIRLILEITESNAADSGEVLYFVIHIGVYAAVYFLFVKSMVKRKHYASSALQSLALMLCALFLLVYMSLLAGAMGFNRLHGIYALFFCLFVLISQRKQLAQINELRELQIQKQLWQKQKERYELSRENIEIINRKCHDLKHQIAALRTIGSPQKQQEVIESIEHSVMIYDSILETGNQVLDTVLNEKSLICGSRGITLNCIADGKLLNFMDPVDLYTMFGNALDNAVEGVMTLKNEEERLISLRVHEKKSLILIQLENSYLGEIRMSGGMPLTHKSDQDYHGFGVKSIRSTAEKYGGSFKVETQNQVFVLRIAFPVHLETEFDTK